MSKTFRYTIDVSMAAIGLVLLGLAVYQLVLSEEPGLPAARQFELVILACYLAFVGFVGCVPFLCNWNRK